MAFAVLERNAAAGLLGGDIREAPAVESPGPWKDNAFGFYPENNELSLKQSL